MTLDCHRRRRNPSMALIDVKKVYDLVGHGWLEKMIIPYRFPVWLSRTVEKLSKSWNTRVMATTKQGRETSGPIRFLKGLTQDDALCLRLFTVCLIPIARKISASKGYNLSKPISVKVTDLLYIDDLEIFASSESKLNRVMESTKSAMEDVRLQWNPKKCAVVHVQRRVQTHNHDASGLTVDENICISDLEEGNPYKFLGVLETAKKEEKMSLECAAKEFLRSMSIIWSSPLSDHNRVTASSQFALPVLGCLIWIQEWPVTKLEKLDKEARKIVVENGGKQPNGSTAILYMSRKKKEERREVEVCARSRRSSKWRR